MNAHILGWSLPVLTALLAAPVLGGDLSESVESPDAFASGSGWHFGVDPLKFGGQAGERALFAGGVSYRHEFEADFDTLPGDVSVDEGSIFLPILPLSNGDWRLITFLNYRVTSFDTSVPNLLPRDTLHSISLPVTLLYDYSDKWAFGGMVMPALSGDLSDAGDAFSFSAAVGAGYAQNPNLRWFGGVFYSSGFGEDLLVPGLGVMWRPATDWTVNILPPLANVSWRFHEDYFLSLVGRYQSTTWNVEADAAGPDRDVNVRGLRLALALERRVAEHIWASLAVGYVFGREMEIENLGDTTLQKDDIDAAPFVQGGLNLRF